MESKYARSLGGGYSIVYGTSFAAPMGAGAAALIWSQYPELSHTEVIDVLTNTCSSNSTDTQSEPCSPLSSISLFRMVALPRNIESTSSDGICKRHSEASTNEFSTFLGFFYLLLFCR